MQLNDQVILLSLSLSPHWHVGNNIYFSRSYRLNVCNFKILNIISVKGKSSTPVQYSFTLALKFEGASPHLEGYWGKGNKNKREIEIHLGILFFSPSNISFLHTQLKSNESEEEFSPKRKMQSHQLKKITSA